MVSHCRGTLKSQLIQLTCSLFLVGLTACAPKPRPLTVPQSSPNKLIVITDDRKTPGKEESKSFGVDIRDVVRYKAELAAEGRTVVKAMKSRPADFFPQGVRFNSAAPGFDAKSRDNAVYGVEFVARGEAPDHSVGLITNGFIHAEGTGYFFRTWRITLSPDLKQIVKIENLRDLSPRDVHFRMKLGLMQRKIILDDDESGIRKIYPVGLGGFEEGVGRKNDGNKGKVKELTPKFKIASLEKANAIFSRTDPDYYAGRPFLRISSGRGNPTEFGFHYSITPTLVRGFVSHGCIRMQEKDLYELYYILLNVADPIPLEMRYWLKDKDDHPFPLDQSNYMRVKNFGSEENPESRRDDHDLTIMENHRSKPPLDSFSDALARYLFLSSGESFIPSKP